MTNVVLNPSPVAIIYDGAKGIQSAAGISLTAHGVRAITIEGIDASTPSIVVQARLSDEGSWANYQGFSTSNPVALVVFPVNFNHVRVIGLGPNNKVICQG